MAFFYRLFKREEAFVELTPEERYTNHLEQEKPVLDALLAWANALVPKTAPKLLTQDKNWEEKLLPLMAPAECNAK